MSPPLAGGYLTTGPPRKCSFSFYESSSLLTQYHLLQCFFLIFFFFLMWTIIIFLNLLQYCFGFVLVFWPGGSLTRDPTCTACIGKRNLEKAMAPHSSTLAWKIPWTEEPGGLQSMGSLRVGHDCATSLSPFTFMDWRRKWQPTPVFLPGECQGWGSLVGCCLWGRTESDTTEAA